MAVTEARNFPKARPAIKDLSEIDEFKDAFARRASEERKEIVRTIASSLERLAIAVDTNHSTMHEAPMLKAVLEHAQHAFPSGTVIDRVWSGLQMGSWGINSLRPESMAPVIADIDMLTLFDLLLQDEEKAALSAPPSKMYGTFANIADFLSSVYAEAAEFFDKEMNEHRALAFRAAQLEIASNRLKLKVHEAALSDASVRVDSIVAHVEEAAGSAATSEIAIHYLGLARDARFRYGAWTLILFACSVASVALSWFIVARSSTAPVTAQEAGRLALVLPILALAGYAGRESSHYREHEAAAKSAAVQLRTVRAFTDSMPPESRDAVMKALGLTLFTSMPQTNKGKEDQSFGVSGELLQLLRQLTESTGKVSDKK